MQNIYFRKENDEELIGKIKEYINMLSIEKILQLQTYLEKIKYDKIKKQKNIPVLKNMHNQYLYDGVQNNVGPLFLKPYHGKYDVRNACEDLGISNDMCYEQFPGEIRNVNIESYLLQQEMTKIPGQRIITDKEIDRFERLPFNPQDHRHIVWPDNMPRGGYATRNERLSFNTNEL